MKQKKTSIDDKNIFVGQKLYKEVLSPRGKLSQIHEVEVLSVGKKYFYLKGYEKKPIDKQTMTFIHTTYSQFSFRVYFTKQEIIDNYLQMRLKSEITRFFNAFNNTPSLAQLKQIADILRISIDKIIEEKEH